MNKLTRIGLVVLGLFLILMGLGAAIEGMGNNRSAEIIVLVITALGAAMIATSVFGGDGVKVEGAHPAFEKLNLSITGPIAAFFLTLFLMLFYSESTTGGGGENGPEEKQATLISVESYCSATDIYGWGEAPTFELAAERAVQNCVFNGGYPDCCPRNVRQIPSE